MWRSVKTAGACSPRSCSSTGILPTRATALSRRSNRRPSRPCWSTSARSRARNWASCRRTSISCSAPRQTSSRWARCAVWHRRIVGSPPAADRYTDQRAVHMTEHPAVGLIGLGLMGSALADRLLGAGRRVIGWDIDTGRCAALRERGGDVAGGAQQVFAGCSRVLLSLPSHREAGEVVRAAGATLGRGPALSLSKGLTIIDTTTGDPASTEELARALEAQGVIYLDA